MSSDKNNYAAISAALQAPHLSRKAPHWRKIQVAQRAEARKIRLAFIADPTLRKRSSKIRRRDRVFSDQFGNGYVKAIDWESRRVVVKYLDPRQDVEYGVGDFTGRWSDRFDGLYFID